MDNDQGNTPNPEVQKLHNMLDAAPPSGTQNKINEAVDAMNEKYDLSNEKFDDVENKPAPIGRRYACHKIVHAAQILKVRARRHNGVILELEDSRRVGVTNEWADRHNPQGGGYYITDEDGQTSYISRFVFESGYDLTEGGEG